MQAICRSIMSRILLLLRPGLCIAEVISKGENVAREVLQTLQPDALDSGIAFPLSISIGATIGDYSPSDAIVSLSLPADRLVRIKLGLFVGQDTYYMGTTVALGECDSGALEPVFPQISGPAASCLTAAYIAYNIIIRKLRASAPISLIREAVESVSKHFGVHLLEGVASYCLAENGLDHTLEIFQNATDQPIVTGVLQNNSIFVIDIIMTDSPETAPKPTQEQPYIYLPPSVSIKNKILLQGKTGALRKELQGRRRFPIARRHISQPNRRQFDSYISEMQPYVLTKLPGKPNIAQVLATVRVTATGCEVLAGPVLPNVVKAPIQPTKEMVQYI